MVISSWRNKASIFFLPNSRIQDTFLLQLGKIFETDSLINYVLIAIKFTRGNWHMKAAANLISYFSIS